MQNTITDTRIQTLPNSVVARITAQLEEDIVLGRLHPRERLVEQELADRFDTHRAAIRQAIFDLEKKGIVERVPNRGAMVRDMKPDDVVKIYAVRETLEIMAAKTIPLPVGRLAIDYLVGLQNIHSDAVRKRDLRIVFRSNLEFHRYLFGLCGNPFLIEGIEHFAQKCYGIRFYSNARPEYLARVRKDHVDMIDALRQGDRDVLVDLCHRHLEPSKTTYLLTYETRFPGSTTGFEFAR